MKIHNGELSFGKDTHGNDRVTARSFHTDEIVYFWTASAATFWLWLIHEREESKKHRFASQEL